jgi:hypothetical protein
MLLSVCAQYVYPLLVFSPGEHEMPIGGATGRLGGCHFLIFHACSFRSWRRRIDDILERL